MKITKKIKISTTTVLQKQSFVICFNEQSHYQWYAQQADISSAYRDQSGFLLSKLLTKHPYSLFCSPVSNHALHILHIFNILLVFVFYSNTGRKLQSTALTFFNQKRYYGLLFELLLLSKILFKKYDHCINQINISGTNAIY